jgi:hypothetical protein
MHKRLIWLLLSQTMQQSKLGGLALCACQTRRSDGGDSLATRQNGDDFAPGRFAQQAGKVAIGIAGRYGFHRRSQK